MTSRAWNWGKDSSDFIIWYFINKKTSQFVDSISSLRFLSDLCGKLSPRFLLSFFFITIQIKFEVCVWTTLHIHLNRKEVIEWSYKRCDFTPPNPREGRVWEVSAAVGAGFMRINIFYFNETNFIAPNDARCLDASKTIEMRNEKKKMKIATRSKDVIFFYFLSSNFKILHSHWNKKLKLNILHSNLPC